MKPLRGSDADYERRAFAAYFRSGGTDQPSKDDSGFMDFDGWKCVVLRNTYGTLAVYRVANSRLRRMKWWPEDLDRL